MRLEVKRRQGKQQHFATAGIYYILKNVCKQDILLIYRRAYFVYLTVLSYHNN